ncbi:hypothetical protein [Streptomyces sp900116325]|uniref:Uncharacterized protein n=1 Tax=Streptomyces sp. 900116325 TaxID=3154295 RepID=A0ABV2UHI8_9ACTN
MPETAARRPDHKINPGPLLHPVAEPGRPGGRFGTVTGGKTAGNDTVRFEVEAFAEQILHLPLGDPRPGHRADQGQRPRRPTSTTT